MKKKRLAALAVALALVLSLSVSVLALNGISIGDVIGLVDSVDMGSFPSYNETSWNALSIDERRSALEDATRAIKGTPHFDNDFLNTSQAYDYYHNLIKAGNSVNFVTAPVQSMYGAIMLERAGQADFGFGFYNDNGHSGGKFGDNTVADTLNNDFLDYLQKRPYAGTGILTTAYKFSNGYYVDWEPLYLHAINGSLGGHTAELYGLRFYLHDETGTIIEIYDNKGTTAYTPLVLCKKCGGNLFDNFTLTSKGTYYFDYYQWKSPHPDTYIKQKSNEYLFPWWGKYGDLVDEPVDPDTVGPKATGTDDNGNQIEFNINSDGVTYEGNTYNYNNDNSVTINGNTYYITVNPNDVNDDYYKQFLQQVINNYYNYYGTDSTPFDDKDIISAVKSVFTSLETFRSYCYSQLKQIGDYISDGFNSMRASLKKIIDRLDDIIKYLKDISKNVEELTEEQEEKNKSDWADLISDFKDKVGWASLDKSMRNIQTAFFGQREYSVHSETGEIQVQILQKNAAPLASSMPNLSITYMGQSYNLYSCVAYLGGDIEPIKQFISLFLWVGFILSVFRSIPSILGGVGALQKDTHFLSKDGD